MSRIELGPPPHTHGLEQRPDIGAPPPASPAGEFGLQIRQANVVTPLGGFRSQRNASI